MVKTIYTRNINASQENKQINQGIFISPFLYCQNPGTVQKKLDLFSRTLKNKEENVLSVLI